MTERKKPSKVEMQEARRYFLKNWKRVADLLCCGMESGEYGSFLLNDYVEPKNFRLRFDEGRECGTPTVLKHIDYPLNVGGAVLMFIKHKPVEGQKVLKLDREALVRGIALLQRDHPRLWADFIKDNEDAITGDAFIQCALLGDIVYG